MLDDLAPDKLISGIIMNIVAQEERHVARAAALAGRDLESEDTVDFVYRQTVNNVIKRFPDELHPILREMLAGSDGLRDMVKTDLNRHKDAVWLKT